MISLPAPSEEVEVSEELSAEDGSVEAVLSLSEEGVEDASSPGLQPEKPSVSIPAASSRARDRSRRLLCDLLSFAIVFSLSGAPAPL